MGKIFLPFIIFMLSAVLAYDQRDHRKDDHPRTDLIVPRGIVPTVFTPLDRHGSVDLDAIAPYAEFLIEHGIKAVLVGGTSGEFMSLTLEDRLKVIDEWVRIGKHTGLYIMVQVGAVPFAEVEIVTKHCVKVGVNGIMTLPEVYFKPRTVDELVFFVGLVAKMAPNLPVTYYHNPNYTEVNVPQPEFAATASRRIPNFKGIKFSDVDLVEADRTNRALRKDQVLWISPENEFAPAAVLGIRSAISPILNILPRLTQELEEAMAKGDLETGEHLQLKLSLAADAIAAEGGIPAFKAAMEIVTGLHMGPPALPQVPISLAARQRIHAKLKALGLIHHDHSEKL